MRLQGNAGNSELLRLECFTAYGEGSCQPLISHWARAELNCVILHFLCHSVATDNKKLEEEVSERLIYLNRTEVSV